MPDTRRSLHPETDSAHHEEVESLATQVLSALAHRAGQAGHDLDEAVLANFCADILRRGTPFHTDPVTDLRRQGIAPAAILDDYIPAAARELGERWTRDELGFADVTIGTARLQALLRDLSAPALVESMPADDAVNAMLIVPADEYHTLGGMAAASQLRRMGLSVCLCLGQTEDEVVQKAAVRRFEMIAISASGRDRVGSVRRLVAGLRRVAPVPVPVVLGGRIAEEGEDLCALTGADFVTSDTREALQLCALPIPTGRTVKT